MPSLYSLLNWGPIGLLGLILLMLDAVTAQTPQLPKLPGKLDVGTVSLELIDYGRADPFAPTPQPRDLLVQIFYPARRVQGYPLAPIFTPLLAEAFSLQGGLPKDALQSVLTQAYTGAPFKNVNPPVLIFSPTLSGPSRVYSGLATFLASEGYLILGIDRPYNTIVVEYPDGRVVRPAQGRNLTVEERLTIGVDVWRQDISFVIDQLRNGSISGALPEFNGSLDTSKVGVYGHALGGATSLATLQNDKRAACGANLDGTIPAPIAAQGTEKPVLLVASADNDTVFRDTANWGTFLDNSRGFKRYLSIDRTQHFSFTDAPAIFDALGLRNDTLSFRARAGALSGSRVLNIQSSFLDAFFGKCLRNKVGSLLARPSKRFSEVRFIR